MESFKELGLSETALKIIKRRGFEEPTPIQMRVIPAIFRGDKDIVGQAQTGTGKTAAFGLPIIELIEEKAKKVQALVLTPTRELAIQVAEEINSLKGHKKLNVVPIYGGQSILLQLRSLRKGVDVVVGTPGRIIDHLKRRSLFVDNISYLVLDEADEMLNMGFLEDVKKIIEYTGTEKRTMLFSATMPQEIMKLAKKHMGEFQLLKVTKGELTVGRTDQIYFEVSASDKFDALCRIIDIEEEFYGLVFCRTKIDADTVASHMIERGYDVDALHGDMSQAHREKILNKFKKRRLNILVATDVAARGIDVQNLTHVINYSLPQDPESYVHRIGRTGRAGKHGIAVTFITSREYRQLQTIQKGAKTDIRRAKLPRVKDVIKTKKLRIQADLKDIARSIPGNEYLAMSRELLKTNEPENILAALLQHSFQDVLDIKRYAEIEEPVVDTKGKTRLLIKKGKRDGLSRKKLIHFIQDTCGIKSGKIKDIELQNKFSFVTLPFHEAEILLSQFRKQKKGQGPFITKVKKPRK